MKNRFAELLTEKATRDNERRSVRAVARATGLSRDTLNKIADNSINDYPSETLEKLCQYFACEVGDLLVLVPEETSAPPLEVKGEEIEPDDS